MATSDPNMPYQGLPYPKWTPDAPPDPVMSPEKSWADICTLLKNKYGPEALLGQLHHPKYLALPAGWAPMTSGPWVCLYPTQAVHDGLTLDESGVLKIALSAAGDVRFIYLKDAFSLAHYVEHNVKSPMGQATQPLAIYYWCAPDQEWQALWQAFDGKAPYNFNTLAVQLHECEMDLLNHATRHSIEQLTAVLEKQGKPSDERYALMYSTQMYVAGGVPADTTILNLNAAPEDLVIFYTNTVELAQVIEARARHTFGQRIRPLAVFHLDNDLTVLGLPMPHWQPLAALPGAAGPAQFTWVDYYTDWLAKHTPKDWEALPVQYALLIDMTWVPGDLINSDSPLYDTPPGWGVWLSGGFDVVMDDASSKAHYLRVFYPPDKQQAYLMLERLKPTVLHEGLYIFQRLGVDPWRRIDRIVMYPTVSPESVAKTISAPRLGPDSNLSEVFYLSYAEIGQVVYSLAEAWQIQTGPRPYPMIFAWVHNHWLPLEQLPPIQRPGRASGRWGRLELDFEGDEPT